MKKIFKYFGVLFSVALMGFAVTSCFPEDIDGPEEVGLGIKTVFPTKVVPGLEITVNGSGFNDVTQIVFPEDKAVTNFTKVTDNMLRVVVPNGVAAGKLIVKTDNDQAESSVELTVGKTVVKGFSKEEDEVINGGDQLTIYGEDLEFISTVEFFGPDGASVKLIKDTEFYRKGTSTVIVTLPKKMSEEKTSITGKITTIDGKTFDIYKLNFEPATDGGHWETVEEVIWENPDPAGLGAISWNGTYRFCLEGTDANSEALVELPAETWERMKTETFYVTFTHGDWYQVRIATGWWNFQWPEGKDVDITPNYLQDLVVNNEDGTSTVVINLTDSDLAANMDVEHFLLTGDGWTPLEIYFAEEVWIEDGGNSGPKEVDIWVNDDPTAISWNGKYRFCLEGTDANSEALVELPAETWERMKTETFYVTFTHGDWYQVRIATGWWNFQWPEGKDVDITPNYLQDLVVNNEDGTSTVVINLTDSDLAANMDVEHFLLTGDGWTPLEIYFAEEVWIEDGGNSGPKEVDIWVNDDPTAISWNGKYRFCLEGTDANSEALVELPAETWERMKTETFYVTFTHGDWYQVRIATGWWNFQWPEGKDVDITPNYLQDLVVSNEDGTATVTINLTDSDLAANMDVEHFLLTGDGWTPLKMFFLE